MKNLLAIVVLILNCNLNSLAQSSLSEYETSLPPFFMSGKYKQTFKRTDFVYNKDSGQFVKEVKKEQLAFENIRESVESDSAKIAVLPVDSLIEISKEDQDQIKTLISQIKGRQYELFKKEFKLFFETPSEGIEQSDKDFINNNLHILDAVDVEYIKSFAKNLNTKVRNEKIEDNFFKRFNRYSAKVLETSSNQDWLIREKLRELSKKMIELKALNVKTDLFNKLRDPLAKYRMKMTGFLQNRLSHKIFSNEEYDGFISAASIGSEKIQSAVFYVENIIDHTVSTNTLISSIGPRKKEVYRNLEGAVLKLKTHLAKEEIDGKELFLPKFLVQKQCQACEAIGYRFSITLKDGEKIEGIINIEDLRYISSYIKPVRIDFINTRMSINKILKNSECGYDDFFCKNERSKAIWGIDIAYSTGPSKSQKEADIKNGKADRYYDRDNTVHSNDVVKMPLLEKFSFFDNAAKENRTYYKSIFNSYHYSSFSEDETDDEWGKPESVCALMQVLKKYDEEVCNTEACRIGFGHFMYRRNLGVHRYHDNGECVDIRPINNDPEFLYSRVYSYDKRYDREKTRELIKIIKKAGGSIDFTDKKLGRESEMRTLQFEETQYEELNGERAFRDPGVGHKNHLHVCFKRNNPYVKKACTQGID